MNNKHYNHHSREPRKTMWQMFSLDVFFIITYYENVCRTSVNDIFSANC